MFSVQLTFDFVGVGLLSPRHDDDGDDELRRERKKKKKKQKEAAKLFRRGIKMAFVKDVQSSSTLRLSSPLSQIPPRRDASGRREESAYFVFLPLRLSLL